MAFFFFFFFRFVWLGSQKNGERKKRAPPPSYVVERVTDAEVLLTVAALLDLQRPLVDGHGFVELPQLVQNGREVVQRLGDVPHHVALPERLPVRTNADAADAAAAAAAASPTILGRGSDAATALQLLRPAERFVGLGLGLGLRRQRVVLFRSFRFVPMTLE